MVVPLPQKCGPARNPSARCRSMPLLATLCHSATWGDMWFRVAWSDNFIINPELHAPYLNLACGLFKGKPQDTLGHEMIWSLNFVLHSFVAQCLWDILFGVKQILYFP